MPATMRSGALSQVEAARPFQGIARRTLEGGHATVAVYEFEPHAAFPMHSHPQEQITIVERGSIEFVTAEESVHLEAGGWSIVASDAPHQVIAGADGARFVAIVSPKRAADGYRLTGAEAPA